MICELKTYVEEVHEKFNKCFEGNPPEDLKTLLDKIDLPSVYQMIMKILITQSN